MKKYMYKYMVSKIDLCYKFCSKLKGNNPVKMGLIVGKLLTTEELKQASAVVATVTEMLKWITKLNLEDEWESFDLVDSDGYLLDYFDVRDDLSDMEEILAEFDKYYKCALEGKVSLSQRTKIENSEDLEKAAENIYNWFTEYSESDVCEALKPYVTELDTPLPYISVGKNCSVSKGYSLANNQMFLKFLKNPTTKLFYQLKNDGVISGLLDGYFLSEDYPLVSQFCENTVGLFKDNVPYVIWKIYNNPKRYSGITKDEKGSIVVALCTSYFLDDINPDVIVEFKNKEVDLSTTRHKGFNKVHRGNYKIGVGVHNLIVDINPD